MGSKIYSLHTCVVKEREECFMEICLGQLRSPLSFVAARRHILGGRVTDMMDPSREVIPAFESEMAFVGQNVAGCKGVTHIVILLSTFIWFHLVELHFLGFSAVCAAVANSDGCNDVRHDLIVLMYMVSGLICSSRPCAIYLSAFSSNIQQCQWLVSDILWSISLFLVVIYLLMRNKVYLLPVLSDDLWSVWAWLHQWR